MSEDTENTNINESEEGVVEEELSVDQLRKELEKTRKEAAAKRVKNKELEIKASKYDELVKAQMSETDRIKAELEEARSELNKLRGGSVRDKVALEFGLDAEMAQLFLGDSDDEDLLRRRAEAIGSQKKDDTPPSRGDFFNGRRGTPVKPESVEPTFSSILTEMWRDLDTKKVQG